MQRDRFLQKSDSTLGFKEHRSSRMQLGGKLSDPVEGKAALRCSARPFGRSKGCQYFLRWKTDLVPLIDRDARIQRLDGLSDRSFSYPRGTGKNHERILVERRISASYPGEPSSRRLLH